MTAVNFLPTLSYATRFNMAATMEERACNFTDQEKSKLCEIDATVVTGFEHVARDDVRKRLGVTVKPVRGKITIFIPFEDLPKLKDLQGVDNLYVVISHFKDFKFADNWDDIKDQLSDLIPTVDWAHGFNVWAKFFDFPLPISPEPQKSWTVAKEKKGIIDKDTASDQIETGDQGEGNQLPECQTSEELGQGEKQSTGQSQSEEQSTPESGSNGTDPPVKKKAKVVNPDMPAFRATCYRVGKNHIFQSPEAAAHFGGAIQDYFGWNVNLKNFNIEVVLNIENDHIYLTLGLTHQSKHKRHIAHFGPTTLRPTIAYNMLTMLDIKPGDVVCDPMCGGGSIPIEAAINWPDAYHICGDIHPQAWPRALMNIQALNAKRITKGRRPVEVDIFGWDSTCLPLKDASVDVLITDMPFGKRSGNRLSNWHLYPRTLQEMARVCKPEVGRACLLTQDKKCFLKIFHQVSPLWRRGVTLGINIGGLAAGVFILHRTNQPVS